MPHHFFPYDIELTSLLHVFALRIAGEVLNTHILTYGMICFSTCMLCCCCLIPMCISCFTFFLCVSFWYVQLAALMTSL